VGVVRNFNYKSLRREVEPMALILYPNYIRKISVRVMPGDIERMLTFIHEKWESTFSQEEFEFSFLDDRINQLYASEKKMQHIFVIFSSLSILVACLGLLGLVSYAAELRTKEIGIRKVLGASSGNVILLMSKDFIKWIIFANIIAWPLAWFLMNKWLQNFAYRAHIGWIIFLLSGLITISISIFTFIFQTVRAAHANPADSLRYE
jgi:putative ABC transport system permease protein